jgi:glycosyltransferase involved in cell wall biosynthesis
MPCIHILTHEYPPHRGGAGTYCFEMGLAASKLEQNIEIWAPRGSAKNDSFDVIGLPWKGSQSLLASYKLIKKSQRFLKEVSEKDIFHLAELGSSRAFLRFGWMLPKSTKLILTIHGTELQRFTRNPLEKWFFQKLLLKCKKIHVLSEYNYRKLVEFCPDVKSRTFRIPGAPSSKLRRKKHLSPSRENGKVRIICVARLHPRKGQDQILLAILKLDTDYQEKLEIIFAGPSTKPSYVKYLLSLKKKSRCTIVFEGDCSDNKLIELYQKSDLFCLTSMPRKKSIEGFGFVYLDASSYELPIIANRIGGVEDAVINNQTGFLCEPGDTSQLAMAIKRLIEDKDLRKKLGANGKEWAAKHSWERAAKEFYKGI